MIRQAKTYLFGAMSGAGLIAIAIAVFVVLVSTQVFTDFPIGALSGKADDSAAVTDARPLGSSGGGGGGAAEPGGAGGGGPAVANAGNGAPRGNGGSGGAGPRLQASTPTDAGAPAGGGEQGGSGGGSGGSGGGGNGSGGNGSGGSGGSNPQPASESASSSGGSGGSKGGGGGGSTSGSGSGSGTIPPPSTTITETVNETVGKVDETVLGGTLEESGVTTVTEEVVNGVAGPESVVGHVVDETTRAVEGLLHPPAH